MHDYTISNLEFAEMTGIYRKLDYSKHGLYIITEFFTEGKERFQQVQVNVRINIMWLMPQFIE